MKKINVLTMSETVALVNTIATNKERLKRDRPSKARLAEELTKSLGFKVTEHNVKNACHAAGVEWYAACPNRGQSANMVPNSSHRVAALEARVAALVERLTALEAALGVQSVAA